MSGQGFKVLPDLLVSSPEPVRVCELALIVSDSDSMVKASSTP